MNMCEFFKNPDKEPYLKVFFTDLEKYGHMMYACPVKKVYNRAQYVTLLQILLELLIFCWQEHYYLHDFEMEGHKLPSFTPLGEYKVEFSIERKSKGGYALVYKMTWFATVTESWDINIVKQILEYCIKVNILRTKPGQKKNLYYCFI